jgi:hypothetical protein
MRSYERNGITVDQCTSCKGIFLDRGELEHLLDAEASANSAVQSQQVQRDQFQQQGSTQKPKKSFLSEFLDFG